MTDLPPVLELQAPEEEEKLPSLTAEEQNDLRKRVLAGYKMTVKEAIQVYQTLRIGQAAATLTGEISQSKKPRRKKREALSDDALDADLKDLGAL